MARTSAPEVSSPCVTTNCSVVCAGGSIRGSEIRPASILRTASRTGPSGWVGTLSLVDAGPQITRFQFGHPSDFIWVDSRTFRWTTKETICPWASSLREPGRSRSSGGKSHKAALVTHTWRSDPKGSPVGIRIFLGTLRGARCCSYGVRALRPTIAVRRNLSRLR